MWLLISMYIQSGIWYIRVCYVVGMCFDCHYLNPQSVASKHYYKSSNQMSSSAYQQQYLYGH